MHGIEECKKGTPRHVQKSNDTKSASVTIQEVCPDITCQAIWNCVGLGSYIEGCNRPLLVKLNNPCDELSILANRHKLLQSSRLLQSLSNLTSLPMKELLKLHFYTKGSYSLSQAQTKRYYKFVLTAFSSKRKSLAQLVLQISSSISLAVCGQQSYLRPSRNRRQLRRCGIQSVFCYSIIYYGIVPSNDHDPPNNDQVNALFCFWNMAIWFNLWPGSPTYQLLYLSQRQTLPQGWSHDCYLRYNSCYCCQCIHSCRL